MSSVAGIFLRPSARTPVRSVASVQTLPDVGLDGDHAVGGRRQVTLLDLEAWQAACQELGQEVDPAVRRANLLITGLRLADTIGRKITVGACRIEILGETRPCELLDDDAIGLCAALRPDKRGGVFGRVLDAATIRVGDAVTVP